MDKNTNEIQETEANVELAEAKAAQKDPWERSEIPMAKNTNEIQETKANVEMAEANAAQKEKDPWEETREVYIPYRRGEEKTLPASVNDKNYAVPKGQRVQVPLPIYYVIQNMLEQIEKTEADAEKELTYHDRGVIR